MQNMITPVNQSSPYAMLGTLNNTIPVGSWLNKTVFPLLADNIQPVINIAHKVSPYMNFSPTCQSVLSTTGTEIACSFYQERQLSHGKHSKSDSMQKKHPPTLADEKLPDCDALSAKKETLQTIYEQPVWGKMETSTTLLSTMALNGMSALVAGTTAASVIPITVTGVMVTIGATVATRLIKRSVYAYRLSQVNAEMNHFNQHVSSESDPETPKTTSKISTKQLPRRSISDKYSDIPKKAKATPSSKSKSTNKKNCHRSRPY